MLAGGQDKDVSQCHERGKSAEKNPPRGEASRSTMTDYFVMLRQVGEKNTKDQEAKISQIGRGFESSYIDNDDENEKGDDLKQDVEEMDRFDMMIILKGRERRSRWRHEKRGWIE